MGLPDTEPRWSLPLRIAFRFVFVYVALYLPTMFFNAMPGIGPESDYYTHLWDPVVLRVGRLFFGLDITVRPNGSGDTTWNYIQVFTFAVLAILISAFWSIADHGRPNYRRLHAWMRVAIRLALAETMFSYGAAKVIQLQFAPPSLGRLMNTYGDSSPMNLLWTFMGYSEGYNWFTGAGELLGGIFLMTRWTTLLGALITGAVMTHVAVLNLCYDVPVKLLSLHCVALALILILPDAKRLVDFFVLDRTTPPTALPPLFRSRWANIAGGVLMPFLLGAFLIWCFKDVHDAYAKNAVEERSPLFGIWTVESWTADGHERPPLTTDQTRWRYVVFDNPRFVSVQRMDAARVFFRLELDEDAKTLKLTNSSRGEPQTFTLKYEPQGAHAMVIDGALMGEQVHATLRRTKTDFFLTNRGFHWINEFPLNR
jgi:hypothetical protein